MVSFSFKELLQQLLLNTVQVCLKKQDLSKLKNITAQEMSSFNWWRESVYAVMSFWLYLGWFCHRFCQYLLFKSSFKIFIFEEFVLHQWMHETTHTRHLWLPLVLFSSHRDSRGLSESALYNNWLRFFIYLLTISVFIPSCPIHWNCCSSTVCHDPRWGLVIKNNAVNCDLCRGHYATSLICRIYGAIRQQYFAPT